MKVDREKKVYLTLLTVLGMLALFVAYQLGTRTLSPTVELVSKQDVVTAGDRFAANFKIYNPYQEPRRYTYALYLNGSLRFEETVTIKPDRQFVFGGHYRALEPGQMMVTAVVYEGDKERLVENITYFVTVNPK